MSVLTVLQLEGGARSNVQIVSCGCHQTRCCILGSEVENRSVTFVEQSVNLGGGMCLCVCQLPILGRMWVCVCWGGACQLGFCIWVASQMPHQVDR